MRIIHRVSFRSSREIRRELARFGHVVPDDGLVSLEIDEADPRWPDLRTWVAGGQRVDSVRTSFSKAEIAAAKWLELGPSWHYGYPQPDDDFGYLQLTYALAGYCESCGIGARQIAPFRMRHEPKWGRNTLLQLNWVFDEFFSTPAVWADVFKPHGVQSQVVLDRRGRVLKTVVQLVIDEEVPIDTAELQATACDRCTRTKYLPHTRGPFPAMLRVPGGHAVRTAQVFGSGASAHQRILVSSTVADALRTRNLRGFELRPVRT